MDSEVINKTIENVARRGPRFALARVVFQGPVSSVSACVAEYIGGARTLSIQSACCSGLDAIGRGAEIVSEGEYDIAICGGAEAPIFYPAEDYHQEYFAHNSEQPYCQFVVAPKLAKFRQKFAARVKR